MPATADKANPSSTTTEGVSLTGKSGDRVARSLIAFAAGKPVSALGKGFDRAPDGTLRLTLDQDSYEALGFDH